MFVGCFFAVFLQTLKTPFLTLAAVMLKLESQWAFFYCRRVAVQRYKYNFENDPLTVWLLISSLKIVKKLEFCKNHTHSVSISQYHTVYHFQPQKCVFIRYFQFQELIWKNFQPWWMTYASNVGFRRYSPTSVICFDAWNYFHDKIKNYLIIFKGHFGWIVKNHKSHE